ncbi:hypothetical protein BS50DRAFT_32827 [Corynespora cassiicola Philippines]|uniref:Uncharacterized protein n=1 Tax=Corynespora cassiicola Philippines TaxID=1448308 RepID=A0A2T2PBR0_CORCC|nr:hypothetical protein BS50DRAFT_32827 [Corynespora cassiicola Philippines]
MPRVRRTLQSLQIAAIHDRDNSTPLQPDELTIGVSSPSPQAPTGRTFSIGPFQMSALQPCLNAIPDEAPPCSGRNGLRMMARCSRSHLPPLEPKICRHKARRLHPSAVQSESRPSLSRLQCDSHLHSAQHQKRSPLTNRLHSSLQDCSLWTPMRQNKHARLAGCTPGPSRPHHASRSVLVLSRGFGLVKGHPPQRKYREGEPLL